MFVDSCLSLFWNTSFMLCAKEKTQQTSHREKMEGKIQVVQNNVIMCDKGHNS